MYINVLSREKAVKLSYSCKEDIVIISISTPLDARPKFCDNPHIKGIFRMSFYDVMEGDAQDYEPPKESDFVGLKRFIDENKEKIDGIIVHCDAGISRSAGCAMAVADYVGCENIVRTQGGHFRPNFTVYDCTRKELGIYYDYAENSAFNDMD